MAGVLLLATLSSGAAPDKNTIPAKAEGFSFAIIADPQISGRENKGIVTVRGTEDLEQSCRELTALKPDFTLFLGDLVNTFDRTSVDNFRQCLKLLGTKIYLVHGNHDTRPPFTGFIDLHQEYNPDIKSVNYSFEHKGWLFVALPCWHELDEEVFDWFDGELKSHQNMPVAVFEHFHLLPIGLSQLEFYSFTIPMRNRLIDMMSRYGNVKYYFNGHVHNGVKASVKTALEYKGIKFITCPTGTVARPFDEEYPGFRQDYHGGYYLTCKVSKEQIAIQGRQAKSAYVHDYPATFPAFDPDLEPRWLKTIGQLPVQPQWTNGDFSKGLEGWTKKYRYMKDVDPTFGCDVVKVDGKPMLRTTVQSPPSTYWVDDEHIEAYRIVAVKPGETVRLHADYRVEKFKNGGGFVRVTVFNRKNEPFLFFFKWGENESESSYVPRCFGIELTGTTASWKYLQDMGAKKRAFFIDIDPKGGTINADLGEIYDSAVGRKGAFKALGVEKIWVSVGTWANKGAGSVSQALFGNIYAGAESSAPQSIGKAKAYHASSETDFGKALEERAKSREKK